MHTVRFRDCACPGTPHPDGDTVTLPDKLSFDENVAALAAIFSGDGDAQASRAWKVYLHAAVAWNVVDEKGAVPLTSEGLDALDFADQYEIADQADTLYRSVVLAPLVRRMSKSSKSGPTTGSSPRRTRPSRPPRGR